MNLPCGNKPLKTSECSNCDDKIATLEENVAEIKDKLKTIEEGAEVNVQADWTEENPDSDSYIQNKPEIDDEMSDSSPNAVENHVIKEYVDGIGISLENEQAIVGEAVVGEAVIGELVNLVLDKADGTKDKVAIVGEGAVDITAENDVLTIEVPEGTAEDLEDGTDTDPKAWASSVLHDYIVQQIGDHFLDLAKTKFVPNFEWSLAEYPESINPNLDGKPVLVLALTDGTNVSYSFLNMEDLIDIYTGLAPISVNGNVISHQDSGVMAGQYGDQTNRTPAFGDTFKTVFMDVDSKGHVIDADDFTVKIPDTLATENNAGLMSADDKIKLDTMDEFYATKCGSIVTVTDASASKAKSVVVELEPVQDLHGYDKPWAAGAGVNILDLEAYIKSRTTNYTVDDAGWVTINSLSEAGLYANHWTVGELATRSIILLIDSTRTTATNVRIRVYNGATVVAETATNLESRQFDAIGFNWSGEGSATVKIAVVNSSTISDWTPYSNICPITGHTQAGVNVGADTTTYDTYTLPLGQTVYGGSVDLVKGEGSDEWEIVDLGTLNWSKYRDGIFFNASLPLVDRAVTGSICSAYAHDNRGVDNIPNGSFSTASGGLTSIWFRDDRFTDTASFKTAVSGVQFCYKKAPTTLSLTPTDIELLLGTNNVWSEQGDTCLTYLKDRGALSELFNDVQNMHTSFQVTLDADEWAETENMLYEQTADAVGMSPNVDVIISPAPADMLTYANAGVMCIAQGNDSLTFQANTPVTVNVNVLIAR